MSYDVLSFKSLRELADYVENRVKTLKERVDELEKRRATLSARAERMRRLEELLGRLVGEEVRGKNELDLMGIRVVVNARAVDELAVLEDTIEAMRDTLTAMARVRDMVAQLARELGDAEGLAVLVQTLNGIPIRMLFKEEE